MRGVVRSGIGRAATLMAGQDWTPLGIEPFPGTLNVEIGAGQRRLLQAKANVNGPALERAGQYVRLTLNGYPCWGRFSGEKTTVEIVADINLRDRFDLADGDLVSVHPDIHYWNDRYMKGGDSGAGSRGESAEFKAERCNRFFALNNVRSVLDIGSGDGLQAALLETTGYLGIDPSPQAVAIARRNCPGKRFEVLADQPPRDLHLSMDVMHHLVQHADYLAHMDRVFSAERFAIVYATDHHEVGASHVLHRNWSADVPDGWVEMHTDWFGPHRWSAYRRKETA